MKLALQVTKPCKFVLFGDIYGPKSYKFIGFRWAFVSQTPVVQLSRPSTTQIENALRSDDKLSICAQPSRVRSNRKLCPTSSDYDLYSETIIMILVLADFERFPAKVGPGTVTNDYGLKGAP